MARDPLNNSELTSKYKYGSLNIADAQRNRTLKSPVKLTNPLNSILTAAENQFDPNLTDSTGPYRAVVLRVEENNSFTSPDSQIKKAFFGIFTLAGTAVRARILEYHHAAIPMPPSLDSTDGEHNFFIDMHDIFYSEEKIDVKVGDIVEVDYRDRKNKKDPLLLRLISSAKQEEGNKTVSASSAVESGGVSSNPPKIDYSPANLCKDSAVIIALAKKIGIPPAVMAAFRAVESGGNPAAIRFEPHLFNKESSTKVPYTDTGKGFSMVASETNKAAFDRAYAINKGAAIRSTSWGSYQVLGWALLSIPEIGGDVNKAVNSFYADPNRISQEMVASWFRRSPKAVQYANNLNFSDLARTYNGPLYANNRYDSKLKQAYDKALADCPEYKV